MREATIKRLLDMINLALKVSFDNQRKLIALEMVLPELDPNFQAAYQKAIERTIGDVRLEPPLVAFEALRIALLQD